MYSIKQIDEALRKYMQALDFDGSRQALEDLIAQGDVEIVSITDGEFVFARTQPEADHETF